MTRREACERPASHEAESMRIDGAFSRGRAIEIVVDGEALPAYAGESVAAALVAAGQRAFRRTAVRDEPRGLYCGIGLCFDCLMTIDGRPNVRACRTAVRAGMRVTSQRGVGTWVRNEAARSVAKLVEVFTNGCPACEGWVAYGRELAGSASRSELRVWDGRDEREGAERQRRIARYGIAELPAIVVDGQLLPCCLPTSA
jgi:hypothetical protein